MPDESRNCASVQPAFSTASGSASAADMSANRPSAVPEQHNQPDGPYGINGRLEFWCSCGRRIQVYRCRLLRRDVVLAATTWRGIVCPGCQRQYTVGIVVSETAGRQQE